MTNHHYYVYIITNFSKTVLYTGVTNNLTRRLQEHYEGRNDSFTRQYRCKYLLSYEVFDDINQAISREKQIKKWNREKKENIISKFNPDWKFLNELFGGVSQ